MLAGKSNCIIVYLQIKKKIHFNKPILYYKYLWRLNGIRRRTVVTKSGEEDEMDE